MTRSRGPSDTPVFHARGVRTGTQRAFAIALWIAALVHLPLLPSRMFDWMRVMLGARDAQLAEMDGEAIIPIDFDLEPSAPPAPPAPPADAVTDPASVPTAAPTTAPSAKPSTKPEIADAGVDAESDGGEPEDAGPSDAGVPSVRVGPDAGEDAGLVASAADAGTDGGAPALRDPLSVAGGASKVASKDPNVQVLISSDRIRKHELGAAFGRLLTTIPEWKGFFEGTGIDPIRDLDHVLITGPQLRDSRKVVAVMDYNLTEAKVRGAIDVVLDRSKPKGSWLEDSPVPAARATADKGERIFALVPDKRLLAVLPADASDQLKTLKDHRGFAKSSAVGILISMVTPARAFKNLPIKVPPELTRLRLAVTPTADGGADVALELTDGSADLATTHAAEIDEAIERIRKPDLGVLGSFGSIELFTRVTFESSGPIIRGRTHVTEHQLRRIMVYAEGELTKKKAAPAKAEPP